MSSEVDQSWTHLLPQIQCKSFKQLDDHPCHCFNQAASTRASSSQNLSGCGHHHWLQSGYCCSTANLSVRMPLLPEREATFSTYCHPVFMLAPQLLAVLAAYKVVKVAVSSPNKCCLAGCSWLIKAKLLIPWLSYLA